MSGQKRVQKPRTRVQRNTRTEVIDGDTRTRSQKERDALDQELDALLDEVDSVLEENAEEFVRGFIQKGGQ